MARSGQQVWTDDKRGLCVIMLSDSPISGAKSNTALYRLTAGSEFAGMALDNQWVYNEHVQTVSRPLREYRPVVTIGEITVYRHKSNGTLYVSAHRTGSPDKYTTQQTDRSRFLRGYGWLWREHMARNIEYESQACALLLTNYLTGA